jgi:hypothetical protein
MPAAGSNPRDGPPVGRTKFPELEKEGCAMSDDFVEVGTNDEPQTRWWRVLSVSGQPLGLGFACPVCHYGFSHHAPPKIKHCRTEESAPFFTANLPVKQIGGTQPLPRNIIPVGW